jgi:hypothetical protein
LEFLTVKTPLVYTVAVAIFALGSVVFGAEGATSPYTDAVGDIDAGISTGNGTLDITGMEVSNTATDVNFKLTVNGNVSTTDWGKFMIGIGSYNAPLGEITGNGWARPINLQYTPDGFPTAGGMDYWIGSWVNSGGGAQLWTYVGGTSGGGTGGAWSGPTSLTSYSFTGGATSDINYSVSLASLGLVAGDQFTFDAYSSGDNTGDSAVDALANPNVAITGWGGPYTSKSVTFGGGGLNSYTVAVPEPTTGVMLGLASVAITVQIVRRQRRDALAEG